jgi:phosphoglycolate phosphatase-like HAD superfamily hydrolase
MIREFSSEYLVAVDSDGCAFDAMNGKHLNVFIPEAVAVFGLENYGDLYPQAAKTVNLFSDLRGCNRFPALYCSLMLAQKRLGQPLDIPDVEPYREFLASGSGLSRDALAQWHRTHPAAVLEKVIEWNDRVNARFKTDTSAHRVFGWVRETLEAAAAFADVMVCSAASRATLVDEWAAGGLGAFVTRIAGQENGTKSEQLQSAVRAGGFDPQKVLMIGDAPGDHSAAQAAGAWFYPIVPGDEEHAWHVCRYAVLPAFHQGRYGKSMEAIYIEQFHRNLPPCEIQPP